MRNLVITAFILAFTASSFAADRNQHRERRQQKRIQQGVASGKLDRHEARKLRAQQRRIDHYQNKAAADGTVDAQEKLKLERMQDRASQNILEQKHDAQNTGP
jgi:hypothetical protein